MSRKDDDQGIRFKLKCLRKKLQKKKKKKHRKTTILHKGFPVFFPGMVFYEMKVYELWIMDTDFVP